MKANGFLLAIVLPAATWPLRGAEVVLRPVADGTIVDGGVYGPCDGKPDAADWYFNESSYEGAVSLVPAPPPCFEHRVAFEFGLSGATLDPPVSATLVFSLRGVARFPADPATVSVHAYRADLLESLADFDQSPAELVWTHEIAPFQVPTLFVIDVGATIQQALHGGWEGVGFRFQIDLSAGNGASQAFLDVLESDPDTKPLLRVTDRLPGDIDGDRDIDTNDYTLFPTCLSGDRIPVPVACRVYDFDRDTDVDLFDFATFLRLQPLYRP